MGAFSLTFTLLQCLGFSLLAYRLHKLELATRFRWFFGLCLFEPIRIGVAAAIPRGTDAYSYYYFITQPVAWGLCILITLEVFRSAFAAHPAIYTLSRKALTASMVAAALIALATLAIDFRSPDAPHKSLEAFLLLERTVALSLIVFVLALMLLLSWFPVQLNRNALAHIVIFSFYFAVKTAMLFSRNIFGASFNRTANTALLCAVIICLILWCMLLVKHSDAKLVRSGVPRDSAEEARLMEQLNAINETLAGSVPK